MLFMVVERFREAGPRPVYQRAAERGRMLPDGLRYVDSWVAVDLGRCFQVMSPVLEQRPPSRHQSLLAHDCRTGSAQAGRVQAVRRAGAT